MKDSELVAAAAASCGADVPLLTVANARYHEAADAGLGLRHDSRVIGAWR